jgi:hypothetical protein
MAGYGSVIVVGAEQEGETAGRLVGGFAKGTASATHLLSETVPLTACMPRFVAR